ncbi:Tat (twin-arginine translocation) pathway signal sequence [Mariniphaga anaerophila]|uniref:Tat (Twin-arginine translocation) pathway signal sequence n=1 Tax=Mariniphaga anaerophila TaxID=1484053 RepID=A0A1M5CKA7_9BACT|nr:aldo/keto reductase [Mariniphaga anaerophila]SHF55131.1 Tat (twin-arginine translocation) pathway signal sequence [Mariniphaga anaerophila]
MATNNKHNVSRRDFIKVTAATTAAVSALPLGGCNTEKVPAPMKRRFGKHNFMVTTLGLGGQASLQWTPEDVDPVPIILKAFKLGINYFDTSNLYAGSQLNFNKAFKKLNLIPGEDNYDEKLRKSIWLTSKTAMRWGKPGWPEKDGVINWSNGENVKCAVDDVKRSLTQLFGDGQGNYPAGAYLDMVLIHTLHNTSEIDVLYEGLETPLDPNGNFGALVALRDLRDGTNLTGMNPKNETLIKHIGFSGHNNPPAMIDMIQRDEWGILEGMLVAINANDRLMFNMQNNVIPVAEAKGLGIIGMKTFADAAMYHKEPTWSNKPEHVFRNVGEPGLPSRPLIEYSLTTPGVHTLIVGIGHIDENPLKCQLVQNFYAAQIEPDGLNATERSRIEKMASAVKNGKTNYFQMGKEEFIAGPRMLKEEKKEGGTILTWQTAYAGDAPLAYYEVTIDGKVAGKVEHKPQTLKSKPFVFETDKTGSEILVAAIDKAGNHMETKLT